MAIIYRLLAAAVLVTLGFTGGSWWSQRDAGRGSATLSNPGQTPPEPQLHSSETLVRPPVVEEITRTVDNAPAIHTLADTAEITSEFEQSAALYKLAGPLDANGIVELLEEAEQVLRGGDYRGGTAILIGRYAELDFQAALDFALAKGGAARNSWLGAIFHARARIDVDDAVQRAIGLSRGMRMVAGTAILRSNNNLSLTQRQSIATQLGLSEGALATLPSDPVDAWRNASNISDPKRRARVQMQALIRWGNSDPLAALQVSEEIDDQMHRRLAQFQLLTMLGADDIDAALGWLDSQPDSDHIDKITVAFATQLAQTDPDAADRLAHRVPRQLRSQIELAGWTRRVLTDPEGAAAWVVANADSVAGERASQQLMMVLGKSSPDTAERFVLALPAAEQAKVESAYVSLLARNDPGSAAIRVEQMANGSQRQSAANGLIRSWSRSDPAAAARWVENQPQDSKPALFTQLAAGWSRSNPQAVQEYAEQIGAGPDRDYVLMGLVNSGQVSPADADEVIDGISDSNMREQARKVHLVMQKAMGNVLDAVGTSLVIQADTTTNR